MNKMKIVSQSKALTKRYKFSKIKEDLRLSQIRFRWSVEGEFGGFVFPAPNGSHAFQIYLEEGIPTRRTQGFLRIGLAWRTEANRLRRKTIFLPAGAREVEAHYVYRSNAPQAQDAREGPPSEARAVREVPAASTAIVPAEAGAVEELTVTEESCPQADAVIPAEEEAVAEAEESCPPQAEAVVPAEEEALAEAEESRSPQAEAVVPAEEEALAEAEESCPPQAEEEALAEAEESRSPQAEEEALAEAEESCSPQAEEEAVAEAEESCSPQAEEEALAEAEESCSPQAEEEALAEAEESCSPQAEEEAVAEAEESCPPQAEEEALAEAEESCSPQAEAVVPAEEEAVAEAEESCPPQAEEKALAEAEESCPPQAEAVVPVEAEESCPPQAEVVKEISFNDLSKVARLYGIAPSSGKCYKDKRLPLVEVAPLIHPGMKKLGEGTYAVVYAVGRAGLPPLCMKLYKRQDAQFHFEEAETLYKLRGVPGLPKLVGLSLNPAAVLMTCHGDLEFSTWISRHFDLDEYLKILLHLSTILHGLHSRGFTHNDLKRDNVVIDKHNVPTLIDVGLLSSLQSRPYYYNAIKAPCDVERRRAKQHSHLAPEIFRGQKAFPSADVYSFGQILRSAWRVSRHEHVREIGYLMVACLASDPRLRPSLPQIIKLLTNALRRREAREENGRRSE